MAIIILETWLSNLLFIGFPYACIAIGIIGIIYRYITKPQTMGAKSSQFLAKKTSIEIGIHLWHIGIILILTGHFLAFILTSYYKEIKLSEFFIVNINSIQINLIEFSLDFLRWFAVLITLIGLLILIWRRLDEPKLRANTSLIEWIILFLFLQQVLFGTFIAFWFRNEPFWFENTIAVWIRSIYLLQPTLPVITTENWFVYVHASIPFIIIALLPFSKLVHLVSFPFTYLWRPYRRIIYNIQKQI